MISLVETQGHNRQEPINQAYRVSVRVNQSVMGGGSSKGCML
jgi:hypothetical protein